MDLTNLKPPPKSGFGSSGTIKPAKEVSTSSGAGRQTDSKFAPDKKPEFFVSDNYGKNTPATKTGFFSFLKPKQYSTTNKGSDVGDKEKSMEKERSRIDTMSKINRAD